MERRSVAGVIGGVAFQKLKTSGRALPEVSGGLTSVLLLTVEPFEVSKKIYLINSGK